MVVKATEEGAGRQLGGEEEDLARLSGGGAEPEAGLTACCRSTKPMRLRSSSAGRRAGYLVPEGKRQHVEAARAKVM